MRALATALASVTMALTAFGLAVAAPQVGRRDEPRAALAASAGAVRIANSRAGQAVFTGAAIRPGGSASGSVRIGNAGTVAGHFSVLPSELRDAPGPYGGRLSERVQLVLLDVTDPQRPETVYAGTPAGFGETDLATFAPGAERSYVVSATLPNGGMPGSAAGGDNRFQGSAFTLGLEWRAAPVDVAPAPTPEPTPQLVPSGAPAPLPSPPAAGAVEPGGAALADALGLPRAGTCVKRRRLTLRLKAPGGGRVVAATITVDRAVKQRLRGAAAGAPVKLHRLPKRSFTLGVTVRTADGRSYTSTRTYRACARKLRRRS